MKEDKETIVRRLIGGPDHIDGDTIRLTSRARYVRIPDRGALGQPYLLYHVYEVRGEWYCAYIRTDRMGRK